MEDHLETLSHLSHTPILEQILILPFVNELSPPFGSLPYVYAPHIWRLNWGGWYSMLSLVLLRAYTSGSAIMHLLAIQIAYIV